MNVFRLEGDYWTVEYEGEIFRLRDGKGVQYLAYLLHHPGEQVGAAELMSRVSGIALQPEQSEAAGTERARSAVSKRIRDAVERISGHHPVLGLHLVHTIKTGRVCGYVPGGVLSVRWSS